MTTPTVAKFTSSEWEAFDHTVAEMDPLPDGVHGEVQWLVKPEKGQGKRRCAGIFRAHWKEPFRFTQPHDELLCQLAGELTVTLDDGSIVDIKVGDSAFFPKGSTGSWDYHGKPLTELFIFFMN